MRLFGGEFLELSRKYAEEKRENLQDADFSQAPVSSGPDYFDDDDGEEDEYYGDGDDDEEETGDGTDERSAYFPPKPRGGGGGGGSGGGGGPMFQPPGMSEMQMSLLKQGNAAPLTQGC